MTTPAFPPLQIAQLVLSQPKHPHASVRSTGGGETRIRLSNIRVKSRLTFKLVNVNTSDLQSCLFHWNQARGTSRAFALQAASLGVMQTAGRNQVLSTNWKYASPPKCVDIVQGFQSDGISPKLMHTISFELNSYVGTIS